MNLTIMFFLGLTGNMSMEMYHVPETKYSWTHIVCMTA